MSFDVSFDILATMHMLAAEAYETEGMQLAFEGRLTKLVEMAKAEEREECASAVLDMVAQNESEADMRGRCFHAIRERGQK